MSARVSALDLGLLLLFWEVTLLALAFLAGSGEAMARLLVTGLGSAALIAAAGLALYHGSKPIYLADGTPILHTFDIVALARGLDFAARRPPSTSAWRTSDSRVVCQPIAYMSTTGMSDTRCPWDAGNNRGAKYAALDHAMDNGCTIPVTIAQNPRVDVCDVGEGVANRMKLYGLAVQQLKL